jgi:multiple sugar transport system ATP-binding protein
VSAKLELRGVRKTFGALEAVKGIDLALQRGEFLSLLGPSGCGKSTTLAMIAGFLVPDAGDILIDGRSVTHATPQKRRIGLVFQDYAVFSKLTVRRNLAFGLEAQRVTRAERPAAIAEYAGLFGLGEILERRGAQLNMSEMQRVAFARVAITKPELLLLDEPMSNLDAAQRATLRGEIRQIQRDLEQTVLYVTHDQVEAMSMSDRVAVMQAGDLIQVGSPEDIYHRPCNRFVAEFIGDPPINVVPCTVQRNGAGVVAATACHAGLHLGEASVEPGDHWLGVRPHSFKAALEQRDGSAPAVVRFVENFGAEHVLHAEYGADLVRVVAPPGFAVVGDAVHLSMDLRHVHLISRSDERVVPLNRAGAAS